MEYDDDDADPPRADCHTITINPANTTQQTVGMLNNRMITSASTIPALVPTWMNSHQSLKDIDEGALVFALADCMPLKEVDDLEEFGNGNNKSIVFISSSTFSVMEACLSLVTNVSPSIAACDLSKM